MHIHYLQYMPFEGLGSIEMFLRKAGHKLTAIPFFESTSLPEVDAIDGLIVMDGPMVVYDEAKFPWLFDEKFLILAVIEAGKPVLGICLGAQLIANALVCSLGKESQAFVHLPTIVELIRLSVIYLLVSLRLFWPTFLR